MLVSALGIYGAAFECVYIITDAWQYHPLLDPSEGWTTDGEYGQTSAAAGITACFMIDASSYLVAAGCSALILREVPAAAASVMPSSPRPLQRQHRSALFLQLLS